MVYSVAGGLLLAEDMDTLAGILYPRHFLVCLRRLFHAAREQYGRLVFPPALVLLVCLAADDGCRDGAGSFPSRYARLLDRRIESFLHAIFCSFRRSHCRLDTACWTSSRSSLVGTFCLLGILFTYLYAQDGAQHHHAPRSPHLGSLHPPLYPSTFPNAIALPHRPPVVVENPQGPFCLLLATFFRRP